MHSLQSGIILHKLNKQMHTGKEKRNEAMKTCNSPSGITHISSTFPPLKKLQKKKKSIIKSSFPAEL